MLGGKGDKGNLCTFTSIFCEPKADLKIVFKISKK